MSKAYVIVEVAFEYNDEFYHSLERNPGQPVIAYRSKEKAEKIATHKNITKLRGLNLGEYSEDPESCTKDVNALVNLIQSFGPNTLMAKCDCGRKFAENDKFCPECGEGRGRRDGEATFSFEDYDTAVIPKDITEEQGEQILKLLRYPRFYKVVEVDAPDEPEVEA